MTPEQIKSLQDTSASFRSQATQFNMQADNIDLAVALATTGYQSDQQAIDDGVAATLQPVNDAISAVLLKVSPAKLATPNEKVSLN